MTADLRERLRRLGVHKGIAHLKATRVVQPPSPADELTPLETPFGFAYVRRQNFAFDQLHGVHRLGEALHRAVPAPMLPKQVEQARFPALSLREALFLDIETSGLNGAGALAFLVGLAYVEGEHAVVEQLFLRNPVEEAALLFVLEQRLSAHPALLTFNGVAFDVPLLQSRFLQARLSTTLSERVHVDLLTLSRRLWRRVLGECSLGALEYHVLGVRRTQQDVHSSIIPQLYREFLLFGNGVLNDDMRRVLYHNEQDVLSMIVLAGRIAEALHAPEEAIAHLAVGQHHERRGEHARAQQHYHVAAQRAEHAGVKAEALRRLARQLKRRGEHEAAAAYWRQLAELDDLEGIVELAKYLEWQRGELHTALEWAQRGLSLAITRSQRAAWRRRVMRLRLKLARRKAGRQAA